MKGTTYILFALYALVLLYIHPVVSHTCYGSIINDSNVTFLLTTSSITHGQLSVSPVVQLAPFSATQFTAQSSFGIVDRIEYKFGYTPQSEWCSYGSTAELTGKYEYNDGFNSCNAGYILCPGQSDNITMTQQDCDGAWNTSSPSFNIFFNS